MLFAASMIVLVIFSLGYPLGRWGEGYRVPSFQSLGIMFGLGLLVGFALGLLTPSIRGLTHVWLLGVLPFLWWFGRDWKQEGRTFWRHFDGAGAWLVLLCIVGLTLKILAEPIEAWDARSIWYFHAKVIFYADHILDAKLWSTPSLSWSHVDYPKLNAFWAAAWMNSFGFWNEYLPKFSLALLITPAIFFCVGFTKSILTRLLLLTILLLNMRGLVWDGYMDGLLAIYTGLGVIHGIRYVAFGARPDVITLLVTAGICCGLKNEGALLGLSTLSFTLAGRWLEQHRHRLQGPPLRLWFLELSSRISLRHFIVGLCSFLAFFIWSGWKLFAGVSNYLTKAANPLDRLGTRLADGHSVREIWFGLFPIKGDVDTEFKILALAALIFWAMNWRQVGRYKWVFLPGFGVAVAYLLVLMAVYLTTPFDLTWQLASSVTRTLLALHTCLAMGFVGTIAALSGDCSSAAICKSANSDAQLKNSE